MSSTLSSRMDAKRSAQVRALLIDTVERTTTRVPGGEPHQENGARPAQPWRPRVPRWIAFGAIAVGAVGLGAGAAVSVTQFLQPDSLNFSCVLGTDVDSAWADKRATVADPIEACRQEWPTGTEVPELAVFMDDAGSVYVAQAGWDAASQQATRVAQDVAFDPRPARLQAALDDRIDGLQSDCFSNDEAIARIESDLEQLGLVGWSTRYEDNGGREAPADGVRTCAWAYIEESNASAREVIVRGAIHGSQEWHPDQLEEAELRAVFTEQYRSGVEAGQYYELSEQEQVAKDVSTELSVRAQLQGLRETFPDGRCLTVEQAEHEAGRVLDPSWNPVVDVSVDDTLACASVEVGLGGTWLVSIVGPATVVDE